MEQIKQQCNKKNVPRGTKNNMKIQGNIIDINNKRIYKGTIVTKNNSIIDIIEEDNNSNEYILPGFVNSHVHIESSMVTPLEFSKEAVKFGTIAVVTDPHEIANVLGVEGINFMLENSKLSPMKFYFGVPSCVPATSFETSGAVINSKTTNELLEKKEFKFLSEMMNFPGVIYDDKEVHAKINAAIKNKKKIDGHAPGLKGVDLKKYIQSGISTDHECTSLEEAIEKIKLGMKIQIREGSAAKDFKNLHQLIDNQTDNVMLCTDDTHPDDLIKGHINLIVKQAVDNELDIYNILQTACVNPVKHYNLEVGLLQKGDKADFIVIDNLKEFNICKTVIDGVVVFENKNISFNNIEISKINNFNAIPLKIEEVVLKSPENKKFNIINCFDGDLFTKKTYETVKTQNNVIISDTEKDILKIVIYNRYKKSEPIIGLIKGFGIKTGAIAQSIAHDSHNIIAVGTNDNDIITAINKIVETKGGIVLVENNIINNIELEIAGLMTNKSVKEIAKKYEELTIKTIKLGSKLKSPLMTLSFMALLVIPEIKIGDKGIFDGVKFEIID